MSVRIVYRQQSCMHQVIWLAMAMLFVLFLASLAEAAIHPPPWADPELNPCASHPRGWQYIFWPQDGQCYKIFQIGYPCPETMELVPSSTRKPKGLKAECRCPPASAFHEPNGRCYEIFRKGPCLKGQYFSPKKESNNNEKEEKIRSGYCKNIETCPKVNYVYWPVDNKCYRKYSRGPCPRGQLLDVDANGIPVCTCSRDNELAKYFWEPLNSCYEHYTRGPCQEKGHLFLPERKCDCHDKLPHYHEDSGQCYELESRGPCKRGHEFTTASGNNDDDGGVGGGSVSNVTRAICKCKSDHVMWLANGNCYRPFTQGPCPLGEILVNSTQCIPVPCARGYLYFAEQRTCYRIGSQGPCQTGQVVTFDFRTRPSVDGISYNGLCGCTGPFTSDNSNCLKEKRSTKNCDVGNVMYKNKCYKLYTQGPCGDGQWLVPNRQGKVQFLWQNGNNGGGGGGSPAKYLAKCDCRPGYSSHVTTDKKIKCLPPSVNIANYLNKYFTKES